VCGGVGGGQLTNAQGKALWKWHSESLCTMNIC
jgi:hypothetical protein